MRKCPGHWQETCRRRSRSWKELEDSGKLPALTHDAYRRVPASSTHQASGATNTARCSQQALTSSFHARITVAFWFLADLRVGRFVWIYGYHIILFQAL